MAQLPLKFPSTFYISPATYTIAFHGSPWRSADSIFSLPRLLAFSSSEDSIDIKALRYVLTLFRSPKRKKGSTSPSSSSSSSRRSSSKFRACFLPSDSCTKIHWDSRSSDVDDDDSSSGPDTDDSIRSSELPSSEEVSNKIGRNSNDAVSDDLLTKVQSEMNASGGGKDEEVKSDSCPEVRRSSVDDSEEGRNLETMLKVMNNSGGRLSMSDAMRKLESVLNQVKRSSGKSNGKKKKSCSFKKYEYRQQQIWTRPILMGKRCRKLNDDFPYGSDEGHTAASAESMAVDNHPKVSDSSSVDLV